MTKFETLVLDSYAFGAKESTVHAALTTLESKGKIARLKAAQWEGITFTSDFWLTPKSKPVRSTNY